MINKIVDNKVKEDLKTFVDVFLRSALPITQKREQFFKQLMTFTLDGQQWDQDEKDDREGEAALTFNSSEDYVERYLARLFPRNPRTGVMEIGVKVYEKDKIKSVKLEKEIMDCYTRNSIISVLLEQGINYLVGGSACFYYPQDPITKVANIISLDPRTVYLGWTGHRLTQLAFDEYLGANNDYNNFLGKRRTTYWDEKNWCVIEDGKISKQGKNEFNFVPFSWIPYFPKPHTHEGRSKILSLYDLDREFNFAASDYSERNSYNTKPERAIFSDSVGSKDADKFKRGKKKTHFLGKDDDMRNLELSQGQEVLDYIKLIDERIKLKTGLISSAGSVKESVSGFSLAYQYSDMMDLIGFMRIFWDEAFRQMNKAILTYKFGAGEYRTDPVYQPFIMYDSKQRVDEYAVMIDKDLISRRDAIDELRGVENPDEKVAGILAEKKEFDNAKPQVNNLNKK